MPASFTRWWVRTVSRIHRLCSPASPRAVSLKWRAGQPLAALRDRSLRWQAKRALDPAMFRRFPAGMDAATSSRGAAAFLVACLAVPKILGDNSRWPMSPALPHLPQEILEDLNGELLTGAAAVAEAEGCACMVADRKACHQRCRRWCAPLPIGLTPRNCETPRTRH